MIKELSCEQLNIPEREGNVLRIQRGLLRAHRNREITMTCVFAGSNIFSFSGKNKDGSDRVCTRTYAAMAREIGCSRSSIARSMALLRSRGLVKRVGQAAYTYTGPDEGFDRVEFSFLSAVIQLEDGSKKHLTKNQAAVLAYLYSHKDRSGSISISTAVLAGRLGMSPRCAHSALTVLKKAGLISRPQKDKGVNRFKNQSTWHLNVRLLNRQRKAARKVQRLSDGGQVVVHKTQAQVDAERRSERAAYDSFNAARRQRAEALADINRRRANDFAPFREADKALRSLDITIVFAEQRGEPTLPELILRRQKLRRERSEALRQINLTDEDFKPKYECGKCNDTGYIDSGGLCPDCRAAFRKDRN